MSFTRHQYSAVLAALLNIRGHGPVNPHLGICKNLDDQLDSQTCGYRFVESNCSDWEHFSGCTTYPVPPARVADMRTPQYKWDRSTRHGQLRYDLLDYLIERARCLAGEPLPINTASSSKTHKPSHGGYPGELVVYSAGNSGLPAHLADPAANYAAIQATAPTTTCECGVLPVCSGRCSIRMRD
jgi:hypothetical protein